MHIRFICLLSLIVCLSCQTVNLDQSQASDAEFTEEVVFDQEKWRLKEGKDYLYRDQMVNDVLYNDTIRDLQKDELLILLGDPDYIRDNHLYYRINETRLGFWTLHTKTMVVHLLADNSIDWIKIHE